MKYFFAIDTNGDRSILVAKCLENAIKIYNQDEENPPLEDIYELTANTFNEEGFLISD